MFTGIITAVGKVDEARLKNRSIHLRLSVPAGWKLKTGESVSVDGICSTVKGVKGKSFEVEYMPETIKKTTAGFFRKGTEVNFEQSLRIGGRLGGHLVQGHVDTKGEVKEVKRAGDSVVLKVGFSWEYKKFIVPKGGIAVNGVSLTVVDTGKNWFTVSLVSYTLAHTNLRHLRKGDKVNLEVDMLARYLAALLKQ